MPAKTTSITDGAAAENAIDRVLRLQRELDASKQEAVEGLLAQRREVEEKLAALGWEDPAKPTKGVRGRRPGTKLSEEAKGRIREAQKERWAASKKQTPAPKAAKTETAKA